jgi:hypothetical protein
VDTNFQTISKDFEVALYVLPLVSSTISMPSRIPFAYGKVPIKISAEYTFGGAVNGTASIQFVRDLNVVVVRNVTLSSGLASLDLDMKNDLKAIAGRTINYDLDLIIFDELTGSKSENDARLTILPYARSTKIKGDPYLKPNAPYNYKVIVKMFDGTPAEEGFEVSILIMPLNIKQSLKLGGDGSVSSSFMVPSSSSSVSIKATVKDAVTATMSVEVPFLDAKEVSMKLDVATKK